MEDNELEAMKDILGNGTQQEEVVEPTQPTVEPTVQEQEPQVTDIDVAESQEESNTNENDIDLSGIDLSFLGVQEEQQPTINNEVAAPQQQVQENNPLQDIISRLDSIQNGTQANGGESNALSEEELAPLKELADKMQNAGLIQGVSEEDRALLQEVKDFKERMSQQEQIQQEQIEYDNKINALDDFSANLEKTIPGYDSSFMQKVVGDIAQKHPEAAQRILDNPMQLLTLWQQVGQNAQPKQEQTNVISSKSKTVNQDTKSLDQKVANGEADENEEALWILNSFK